MARKRSFSDNTTMARKKYKPRAGEGAMARILTKMIYPKRAVNDPKEVSFIVLISEEEKSVNRRQQLCYTFYIEGDTSNICYASKRYVHVIEEGNASKLFDPSLPGPHQQSIGAVEKEKWRKSKAKRLLYEFLMDGIVPMEDDGTMSLEDIYMIDPEFSKFDFDKFKGRLNRIRSNIMELDIRADDDLEAFRNFKLNHKPSLFSHKGYTQWQGSTAQELLWDDLDEYLKDPNSKPRRKMLVSIGGHLDSAGFQIWWDSEIKALDGKTVKDGFNIQLQVDPRWVFDDDRQEYFFATIASFDTVLVGVPACSYDHIYNMENFPGVSGCVSKEMDEHRNAVAKKMEDWHKTPVMWYSLKFPPRPGMTGVRLSVREIYKNDDFTDETSLELIYFPTPSSHTICGNFASWWATWNVVCNDIGQKDSNRKRGTPAYEKKKSKAAQQAALFAQALYGNGRTGPSNFNTGTTGTSNIEPDSVSNASSVEMEP
ncbi:hypothetical protein IV203_019611 [Nitzschia inconspicua]|uniref:Uncharacterized protein n=1 Tax=Nitzschia inconspicua TaxID=303405 RepID=A0A9K3M2V2_9STRA|nr:hypothetical protein IV203_019611 [Nitzschia inconspicua]